MKTINRIFNQTISSKHNNAGFIKCLAFLMMLFIVGVSGLNATIPNNQWYHIEAKSNRKHLDVEAAVAMGSSYVKLKPPNNSGSQRWYLIEFSNDKGNYVIVNELLQALEVSSTGHTKNKVMVKILTYNEAQKWRITYAGDGYYYIQSKLSGKFLLVNGKEFLLTSESAQWNFKRLHLSPKPIAQFEWVMQPKKGTGYDASTHKYDKGFIADANWSVSMDLSLSLDENGKRATEDGNLVAYEWHVEGIDVEFKKSLTSFNPIETISFPKTGSYNVTAIVHTISGQRDTISEIMNLQNHLIVSIGDSFSSGEGNPELPLTGRDCGNTTRKFRKIGSKHLSTEAGWLEPEAHRSRKAGTFQAVELLETIDPHSTITFLSFATTGAEVVNGLMKPGKDFQKENNLGGQIDEVANTIGERTIDALLISIGVNDLGFSDRIEGLLLGDLTDAGDNEERDDMLRSLPRDLRKINANLGRLNKELRRKKFDINEIYLAEYPNALFDDKDKFGQVFVTGGCGLFETKFDADISDKDARAIKEVAGRLNSTNQGASRRMGWNWIGGITKGFEGHGYCSGSSFFVFAETSCEKQGDFKGMLHPNSLGHKIYRNEIFKALLPQLLDNRTFN